VVALFGGIMATYLAAWSCAAWSPEQSFYSPMENPQSAVESIGPDGQSALLYHSDGFGWSYIVPMGHRLPGSPYPDWSGPYGGVYHQLSGWPFFALRSRVEIHDSQAASRTYEDDPNPPPVVIQRTRWQLPRDEIIRRGLNTSELPKSLHVRPNRRLALIPIPLGFAANTLIYAIVLLFVSRLLIAIRRRIRPQPPGFPVVMN
jgi:hypothetical protein